MIDYPQHTGFHSGGGATEKLILGTTDYVPYVVEITQNTDICGPCG